MIKDIVYFSKENLSKNSNKKRRRCAYDIYACFDEDYIILNPLETKLIPNKYACSKDYCFILKERVLRK